MPERLVATDSVACWVGLNHVQGIGPARTKRLLAAFGDIVAAWNAPSRALRDVLDRRAVDCLLRTRRELDLPTVLARLEALGARVITWDMDAYPPLLREIAAAPRVLYVQGDASALLGPSAAVVGTRRASRYGRDVARLVAGALPRTGFTVVSGLATGIDAEAHRACLDAGGRTIAVLGCGPDRSYPEANRDLRRDIARHGAVLTEYPPGTAPLRGNFPARNRIVSGLAIATIVVEAGARSGALSTASHAADQGRDVYAVPGSIFSPTSIGTNRLIANGAVPVTDLAELLLCLGVADPEADLALGPVGSGAGPARRLSACPDDVAQARLLAALEAEPRHVDELAEAVGLAARDVARALTYLELKGMACYAGRMRWVAGR